MNVQWQKSISSAGADSTADSNVLPRSRAAAMSASPVTAMIVTVGSTMTSKSKSTHARPSPEAAKPGLKGMSDLRG